MISIIRIIISMFIIIITIIMFTGMPRRAGPGHRCDDLTCLDEGTQ